jgi:hypothetical protein
VTRLSSLKPKLIDLAATFEHDDSEAGFEMSIDQI